MPRTTTLRLRGATLLLASTLALSACGGASDRADAPSSSTSSSASPTGTAPAETPAVEPATVEPAEFSGPAVDAFGLRSVQDAYATVAEYLNETTFNETLLSSRPAPSAADFEFATPYMTSVMADDYRSTVQKALAGDEAAGADLNAMSFTDIENDTGGAGSIQMPDTGPVVTEHVIRSPQTAVNPNGTLQLIVTETAVWHLVQDGARVTVPVTKTTTFALAPGSAAGPAWLIDGQNAQWQATEVSPDTSAN